MLAGGQPYANFLTILAAPSLVLPERPVKTQIWDLNSRDKIKFWVIDPETGEERRVDYVAPRNKWELQRFIEIFFGYKIASTSVCPGHCAPLDAMWAAYNADPMHSVIIWKASRGLGGKTTMLGLLGFLKLLNGANTVILGGSSAQSKRVHELSREAWEGHVQYGGHEYPNPFRKFLLREPTQFSTVTLRRTTMTALTASQRAVRGPHPQALLLDEIDEMDVSILNSAKGQTMNSRLFPDLVPVTVMSSTHQYPNGTMTKQLEEAKVKGWSVFEWCVARGTLIDTPTGKRKVETIKSGDIVWSWGKEGFVKVPARDVWSSGIRATLRVQTEHRELICTPDHKLLTERGWVRADSLTTRDNILQMRRAKAVSICHMPKVLQDRHGQTKQGPSTIFGLSARKWQLAPQQVQAGATRVVSVTVGPIIEVWDIAVPETHSFIAEGLIVHNCWRETHVDNGGWLTEEEKERKRNEVPAAMWEIEYDLQEPSGEGRVFPQESLNKLFVPDLGSWQDNIGKTVYFERPKADATYAHGSDWARKQDQTINVVLRTDKVPAEVVAFHRDQKRPWPVIISVWDNLRERYPGRALHDVTGIGDVIEGFFENSRRVEGFYMVGKPRAELFTDYTLAVEHNLINSPVIATLLNEHKYCTLDDLYGSGNDDHPPDSIVAMALAWRAKLGKFAHPGGRVVHVGKW